MKKILIVGSEAVPFAATGGLGDVLGSLPAALQLQGGADLDVRVVMPLYGVIEEKYRSQMTFIKEFSVKLAWRNIYCGIWSLKHDSVTYYFIDNEYYFKREHLYGNFDDAEIFAFFAKSVMEMLPYIDFYPDILHANDWQSALTVIYLKQKYYHLENYRNIKSVYTIHNIDYQGIYDFDVMCDIFELDPWDKGIVEYGNKLNLVKGAIVCCDMLTTVSPRYSQEIQTETFSSGLHHVLGFYKDKTRGILNGIDVDYYNPAIDGQIFQKFTHEDLEAKSVNKIEIQKMLSLPVSAEVPMIAMITRLTAHKGLDLVTRVIEEILGDNVQFLLLGKGDMEYENYFLSLHNDYPAKVGSMILYNKDLSKKVYAAADMFLMPSRSEPCGLSQMISSRYGVVPIVRETGGLYDSIKNYDEEDGSGNGFTFKNYNAHEMLDTIKKALNLYSDKEKWTALVQKIMQIDFSWGVSAIEYINMYEELYDII